MASLAVTAEQVYNRMVDLGFFKYFLPWLLAFVVIYGILRKIDMFDADGENDEWHVRLYGLMSAIIATLIVAYVPFQTGAYAAFLSTYFGSISLILLVIVGFVLIYGLITGQAPHEHFSDKAGETWFFWAVGLTILFLLFSSGFFGTLFPGTEIPAQLTGAAGIFANPSSVAFLIIVAIILLALYWVLFGAGTGGGSANPDDETQG